MAVIHRKRLLQLVGIAFVIAAVWAFVGAFFASQQRLVAAASHSAIDESDSLFIETACAVIAWALLTPFVIVIAERLPVARPHALRNTLWLALIGVMIAFGRAAFDATLPVTEGVHVTADLFRRTMLFAVHSHLLFFVVITSMVNLLRLRREADERERRKAQFEAELAHAQLRRLRNDLQPHFLFNALNAVAAQVHTDPAAAERSIASLVDLLRRSVDAAHHDEVALSQELDFIETYLELQKLRFGDRLRSQLQVADPALLEARVPPLLLQPLVENSIVHGIRPRSGGGSVAVRVFADDERLHLEVRDDGPGCDPDAPFHGDSIGVPNTAARLEYLYHDPRALTFRREGEEFVADVAIPLRFAS